MENQYLEHDDGGTETAAVADIASSSVEVKPMRMKRSGRASILVIAAVALVAAIVVLFFFAGESPTGVTGEFLGALARGDTKKLAALSYMDGMTEAEIEQKWQQTHEASKYWQFAYILKEANIQDESNATVRLEFVKDAASPGAYSAKAEIPLVKKDGKWKIDVRGISRDLYPSLPR